MCYNNAGTDHNQRHVLRTGADCVTKVRRVDLRYHACKTTPDTRKNPPMMSYCIALDPACRYEVNVYATIKKSADRTQIPL